MIRSFLSVFVLALFAVSAVAQSSGGVNINVPGVGGISGAGVNAGVRVLGTEVVGVGVGVGNPPVPQPAVPKTTLPDMFMMIEQNLAAALAGLNAILATPGHTAAQVNAQQALIETLRSLKDSMGRAITPATTGN